MEIQDSLPERRNLIIISLAFIIYFYAGGQFTGEEIKLVVINAKFTKPLVLQIIVWLGFFYCIWRYWLVTRGEFLKSYAVDTNGFLYLDTQLKYIQDRCPVKIVTGASYDYSLNFLGFKGCLIEADIVYNRSYSANIALSTIQDTNLRKIEFYIRKHGEPPRYKVRFNDISGIAISLVTFFKVATTRPSVTLFLMPYLLVTIAIGGALTI